MRFLYFFVAVLVLLGCNTENKLTSKERYEKIQRNLSEGWNTWDTYHILNHVLLPEKVAVGLYLIDSVGRYVNNCQIGNRNQNSPFITPGERSFDGYYTELSLEWYGHRIKIQTASNDHDNTILITPYKDSREGLKIAVYPHIIWNGNYETRINQDGFKYITSSDSMQICLNGTVIGNSKSLDGDRIIVSADEPILIRIGSEISMDAAVELIHSRKDGLHKYKQKYSNGEYECFDAMQSVLAWDNIYCDELGKVITPVSRIWNSQRGGYVLFCWDAYFASMMLSHCNKELAYANMVEITNSQTPEGFIPNRIQSGNRYTSDHSQPPVGSLALWHVYSSHGDKWLLELLFDKLLIWNRWWHNNRNWDGLMCWGSNLYRDDYKDWYRFQSTQAASLESGMDNTHMYDGVDFDKNRNMMCLQDVGLSSLYVMDCRKLALIAKEIDRTEEYDELTERANIYARNIQKLWSEEDGMFYNRDPRTGVFNKRISPTNLYVMLAKAATSEQVKRIVHEHMLNPQEMGGEWLLPATPRNDEAFNDNNYWRGRIWAPLNFLVYLGMKNYDLPVETELLVKNSKDLLMKGWTDGRYVFENYNSVTGQGDDVYNSDKFYHWGALLGYMSILENK